MSPEPPPPDALYRLLIYARDEAREQDLRLIEYLLGVAAEDLGERMLRHRLRMQDREEQRT